MYLNCNSQKPFPTSCAGKEGLLGVAVQEHLLGRECGAWQAEGTIHPSSPACGVRGGRGGSRLGTAQERALRTGGVGRTHNGGGRPGAPKGTNRPPTLSGARVRALTLLQQVPQAARAPLPAVQLLAHVLPPLAAAQHAVGEARAQSRQGAGPPPIQPTSEPAARPFDAAGAGSEGRGPEGRAPTGAAEGQNGGGRRRGCRRGRGRLHPRLGQRAAAAAGGAGARDRGGAAERGHGDPGAEQGEARRAPPRPPRLPVRGLRPEGGVRALRPDPLLDPGGHRAAPRGVQLLRAEGLPDGPQAHRLRPREARGARANLRADAGAVAGGRAAAAGHASQATPPQATPWCSWPQMPPRGSHGGTAPPCHPKDTHATQLAHLSLLHAGARGHHPHHHMPPVPPGTAKFVGLNPPPSSVCILVP